MRLLGLLSSLFSTAEKARVALLLLLMLIGSLLELSGIGLIFPYISVLQDPQQVRENRFAAYAFDAFGFASYRSFFISLSVVLLAVFLTKAVFTVWLNKVQMQFVFAKQQDLGRRLLAGYLYRPYAFFLATNTSTLIGNLTTSLGQLAGGVLQSALALAAESIMAVGLICFLFYLDPVVSLLAVLLVAVLGAVFARVVKVRIAFYALENDARWKAMIRVVNEGLSSAKELQILGRQDYFVRAYAREFAQYSAAVRKYNILTQLPRVFLETMMVAGMVLFATFALLSGRFQQDLFPVLAVFAVAAVRIVPSASRIVQAWNAISFYAPSIEIVQQGLRDAPAISVPVVPRGSRSPKMGPQPAIRLEIASFRYPADSSFHLQNIELDIGPGEAVAFIGPSGSGKTTLVDILLGVYPQFEGKVLVGGRDIRSNPAEWRARLGYIPQTIYLSDDTILRNVAFGIPDDEVDIGKVGNAVRLAGLDRVVNEQASGLQSVVGDRGIRLSGGERQRIGIARALYHDPQVLVLDEATSALDNAIERQIVDSILRLSPAKTIIVIAHRLSTVEKCDRVYLMRDGRIIDQGRFEELAARHPEFVNPPSTVTQGARLPQQGTGA